MSESEPAPAPSAPPPAPVDDWFAARAPALRQVGIGTLLWAALFFGGAYRFFPEVHAPSTMARVLLALQWGAAPAALILLMVTACARIFDSHAAADPFARAESRRLQLNLRVLTNSVEQTVIFLPLLLALSTVVDGRAAKLLPLLTSLFVLGRILFWIGIHIALRYRTIGFVMTLYTSLAAVACFVYYL